MQLLDLAIEILTVIPHHLHSLADHFSLLRTYRTFYDISQTASGNPSLPPVLPEVQGQNVLPPHPYLLLAGTTRQLADWGHPIRLQSDLALRLAAWRIR